MGIEIVDDAWDDAKDAIEDLVDANLSALGSIWEEIHMPILEGIANLLGFHDETIYATFLNTTKLVEDTPPDNLAATIYAAILQNEDIRVALQRLILTGTVASANKYYEYGENHFINALPTVKRKFRQLDEDKLVAVIEGIQGEPITLLVYGTGNPDIDIWAKYYLETNVGYADDTKIVIIDGITWFYDYAVRDIVTGLSTVYVSRGITTLISTTAYTVTKITPLSKYTTTSYTQHTTITSNVPADTQTTIAYLGNTTNEELLSSPETGNFKISVQDSNSFIGISSIAEPCNIGIFGEHTTTQESSDTIENSVLGYLIPAPETTLYYYASYYATANPTLEYHWAYLADDGLYPELLGDFYTSEYPELLAMPIVALKKDYVTIEAGHADYPSSKALMQQINLNMDDLTSTLADNPDADKVRDAFFTLSINLYTQKPGGLDYLFKFFSGLAKISVVTKTMYEAATVGVFDIGMGITHYPDGPMNTLFITEGSYNVSLNYNYMVITEHVGSIGPLKSCTSEYDALPKNPESGYIESTFTIRWQYSSTMYREIFIHGLFLTTILRHTNGDPDLNLIVISNDSIEQKNFEIPLVLPTLQVYDYKLADALIYEALTMQVFAADKVDLEYYETEDFLEAFSLVIKIIAIIVLVFSVGTASNIAAALWALATTLLVQYALTLALMYILENSSSDTVRYLAILGYVIASAYGMSNGGVDLTTAVMLLNIVSAVTQAINIWVSVEADIFANEVTTFLESSEERQEEIDRVADLLSTDSHIDFWDITKISRNNPNESPTEFFYRTGLRNPGVLSLDGPSNYVDSKLTLPVYDPSTA